MRILVFPGRRMLAGASHPCDPRRFSRPTILATLDPPGLHIDQHGEWNTVADMADNGGRERCADSSRSRSRIGQPRDRNAESVRPLSTGPEDRAPTSRIVARMPTGFAHPGSSRRIAAAAVHRSRRSVRMSLTWSVPWNSERASASPGARAWKACLPSHGGYEQPISANGRPLVVRSQRCRHLDVSKGRRRRRSLRDP